MDYFMIFLESFLAMLLIVEIVIQIKKRKTKKHKNINDEKNNEKHVDIGDEKVATSKKESTHEVKVLTSTDVAPFCPVDTEPQPLSIDDLRNEAAIYMKYGHYAQAATVLRWYVDMNPHDHDAINQLLDAYLALADMDAYTNILSALGESMGAAIHSQNVGWLAERVYTGLRNDPGNLELLVLAERLGMPIPLVESTVNQGGTSENLTQMTTAAALALVSRNPDPSYGASILRRAILNDPLRLPLHAELLRITHQQKDIEQYGNALILLYLCVGSGAKTLRDRMLRAGMSLGDCALWSTLSMWDNDIHALVDLAGDRGIQIPAALNISHDR